MPKGTDCGAGMTCDGFGTCGPAPECSMVEECDDGNPCTIDTCNTFYGLCGHGPAGGHAPCPGGVCLEGGTTCCKGCNNDTGNGYVCVASCPLLKVCISGFCS